MAKPVSTTSATQNGADSSAPLAREVDVFVRNTQALSGVLPLVMLTIGAARSTAGARVSEYAEEFGEIIDEDDKQRTFLFKPPFHTKASRLRHRVDEAEESLSIVPRSFLVALVSEFDSMLGRLLRALFVIRPELLDASERTLSLRQLMQFGRLEDARDYLLEKEIEAVLRKSHAEQFDWMEKRFGVKLKLDLSEWTTFIEVTERRNLFVHSGGYVSDQYLAVCQSHGVDTSSHSRGDYLSVEPKYFESALACILQLGLKLANVLWRKILPDDRREADANFISVTYDLLARGKFSISAELLDFSAKTFHRYGSDEDRRIMLVNQAQAHKWKGDEETCRTILRSEDWSASATRFRLCAAVLEDRFEDAAALMEVIGAGGEVTESAYEDWPIFRRFRDSEDFLVAYEKVFGKPFVHLERVLSDKERERTERLLSRFRDASIKGRSGGEPGGDPDKRLE